jgi:hypothetical protein
MTMARESAMTSERFAVMEGRRMDDATGEAEGTGLRVAFDRRLKLEFHRATVTSDAGLLAFRDLDDALGLTALAGDLLVDPRTGKNGRHTLLAQFRRAVFGRLAGYEDVNDADRLGRDPAMRWVVGGRAVTDHAASTSQMGRPDEQRGRCWATRARHDEARAAAVHRPAARSLPDLGLQRRRRAERLLPCERAQRGLPRRARREDPAAHRPGVLEEGLPVGRYGLAAAVWLIASLASAAPAPFGTGNPAGLRITQDGANICEGQVLDFASADFACACTAAGPACTLAPTLSTLRSSYVDSYAGVNCLGTSDSTAGVNAALAANAGKTLVLPAGCKLGLASPGAGHAAVTIPNSVHILCADQSAGFFAVRQRCVGGTYPDAHCTTSADCLGGGTCSFDFGSSTFAPAGASTYTMLKDQSATSSDIIIENCSIWTYQADPYESCTGGTNAGRACRQECDDASTAPGLRCETSATCGAGSCLRTADCNTAGGTCNSAPGSPAGSGSIIPLDLSRTTGAKLVRVSIYDHFKGAFGITTGTNATLYDVNAAREITDCTTPIPSTPSSTSCFTTNAGKCCYGAASVVGNGNTQPTTAVTNDIVTGAYSQLVRCTGRGSTTSFSSGAQTRIDESTVWPPGPVGTFDFAGGWGPGTAANGFSVGDTSQVAKSYALNLASGATCVALTGNDSGAIGNKCNGTSILKGVVMSGANSHAIGMNIKGLGAANAIGVAINGANSTVSDSYIEGSSTTGIGVDIAAGGDRVESNQISSNPNDNLNIGVQVETGGSSNHIGGNYISRMKTAAFSLPGGSYGNSIEGNTTDLYNGNPTTALHPIHVLNEGSNNQIIVSSNVFRHGWRGFATGARTDGLTNTNIANNRFIGLSGAPIAAGGAGVVVEGNYLNLSGDLFSNGTSLTCDASCSNRGVVCQLDSDCTSCNASVHKCIPEPVNGFIGSPTATQGANHNSWIGNVMFNGQTNPLKQCTVAGNIGQKCDVASCAGGATCSGGPPATCQSGADSGKFCCQTAAGATCAIRDPTVHLRAVDYGSAIRHTLTNIIGNTFFGGTSDVVDIDMQSTAALGNLTLTNFQIGDNNFLAPGTTNTVAIKFPTSFTSISGLTIAANSFSGYATPASTGNIANYQGSFGSLDLSNGITLTGSGTALRATAGNDFFPINTNAVANTTETGVNFWIAPVAMTVWKLTCSISVAPGAGNTRDFFVRAAATTSSALKCTITGASAKTCTPAAGATSAPFSVTAGQSLDFLDTATGTPAAATGTCTVYASYDTYF